MASAQRQVIKAAWREYQVTRQCGGASDVDPDGRGGGVQMISTWRTPGWFRHAELGLGVSEGPSILYTLANLKQQNERARKFFEAQQTPPSATKPKPARVGPDRRRRVLRALARRAGIGIANGKVYDNRPHASAE